MKPNQEVNLFEGKGNGDDYLKMSEWLKTMTTSQATALVLSSLIVLNLDQAGNRVVEGKPFVNGSMVFPMPEMQKIISVNYDITIKDENEP